MRFLLFLLSIISVVCAAENFSSNDQTVKNSAFISGHLLPKNSSAKYKPLYQPYSNSTPVFQNHKILHELSSGSVSGKPTTALTNGVCAPGHPCVNGACCSSTGVCSYAPSSCAQQHCISNCDAKAPCGQYGAPSNAICPLNACCSQHGFCGTLDDFCGTGCQKDFGSCGPANTPSCAGTSSNTRRIGYYESWSNTRFCDKRAPEDLDLTGLTHLNFAFTFFDPETFQISPMDSNSASLYTRFTALKSKKASLQTWISVGGWTFNDDANHPNTRSAFSNIVSSASNRATFIKGLASFMKTYGFDGIDIDWEYPGADDRGGNPIDLGNFAELVAEMRASFGSTYGISATLSNAEIKPIIDSGVGVQGFDATAAVRWLTWDSNQWVSFDDGETMQLKIQAANDLCLGGSMIWSVDQDNIAGDSLSDILGIGIANGVTKSEAQAYKKDE